jgi:hypothetical protein
VTQGLKAANQAATRGPSPDLDANPSGSNPLRAECAGVLILKLEQK